MKSPPSRLQRFSTTDIRLGVAITVAIIGIWFMGDFHSMHDSDSVIHSLNSLYRWTVFVWEYDHVGQLLSLLTRVITRPYWNVLAISTLSSLLFLIGLALWASLISPITFAESSLWVALLIPVVLTKHTVFQLASHSITSGAALFFSGWYVFALQRYLHARPGQMLVAALFGSAFLATYLSKVAFIPIATVTVGLLWANRPPPWRNIVAIGACLVLALFCYQLLEQASPFKKDYTLYLASLPIALPRLLDSWGTKVMTGIAWLATPVVMMLYRPTRHNPLFLALCVGVLIQTLIIACSRWAALNGYDGHYLFDLSFLALLAVVGPAVSVSREWLPARLQRALLITLAVGAIGLNAYRWDAIHPANPLTRMEQTIGKNTAAIVTAGCDLIVADYWKAWPAMLAVNDYYYRNNILDPGTQRPRRVYAITSLAASTKDLWRPILDRSDARFCSLADDAAGYQRYLGVYVPEIALQTVPVAQIGAVIVHRVQFAPLQYITLDFDQFVPGKGWNLEETNPDGVTFQWTDSTDATILLPLGTGHDMHIVFRILYAMSADILQSLTLRVNDQPILLSSTNDPGGATIFQGTIPQSALEANSHYTILAFHINRTLIPQFVFPNSDDGRALGLAFDWLRIVRQPWCVKATVISSIPECQP